MHFNSNIEDNSLDNWDSQSKPYFIIGGPCSAESSQQIDSIAKELSRNKISFLRAGAWKPRTLPGAFEGFGEIVLDWLVDARQKYNIEVGTEVGLPKHVEACLKRNIRIVWIGTRTTPNPFAVQEIANAMKDTDMMVLVKNPICPEINLWIGAIERLKMAGITRIAAIHRGFSTPRENKYRYPALWWLVERFRKKMPEVPIICDPSHICGKRELLDTVIRRALKNNYNGFMIEVHHNPDASMTDGGQQVTPTDFYRIVSYIKRHNKRN